MDFNRTLGELETLPRTLREALRNVVECKGDADEFRVGPVAVRKEQYDWIVAEATLEAMADGTVDGKNQAQRDVQLTAALAKNDTVLDAHGKLLEAEAELARFEQDVAMAEAEAKALSYRLRAAMAAAELQAAMLNAGIEGETDGDD